MSRDAKKHAAVERIVVFGSRVRGDFTGESDLDLLVILKDVSARDDAISFLYDIEVKYDVPFSPVIYSVSEYMENKRLGSRFIGNVEREGVVLYDAQRKGKG